MGLFLTCLSFISQWNPDVVILFWNIICHRLKGHLRWAVEKPSLGLIICCFQLSVVRKSLICHRGNSKWQTTENVKSLLSSYNSLQFVFIYSFLYVCFTVRLYHIIDTLVIGHTVWFLLSLSTILLFAVKKVFLQVEKKASSICFHKAVEQSFVTIATMANAELILG